MFSIYSIQNDISYGIKNYILDFTSDIQSLSTENLIPGSTIFIIETSERYMLNHNKEWVKIQNFNQIFSGAIVPDEYVIYEGGEINGNS